MVIAVVAAAPRQSVANAKGEQVLAQHPECAEGLGFRVYGLGLLWFRVEGLGVRA